MSAATRADVRRRLPSAALPLLGVCAVVGVVLLAARAPSPVVGDAARLRVAASAAPTATTAAKSGGGGWTWVWLLGLLTLTAVALVLALRDGVLIDRSEPDGDLLPDEDDDERSNRDAALRADRDEALADAATALAAGGEPREVVIACWVRLEDAAARAGQGRRPAETSSEFAARILAGPGRGVGNSDGFGPGRADIEQLDDLFREARFSAHPLTEAHRRAALTAIGRLTTPSDGIRRLTTT